MCIKRVILKIFKLDKMVNTVHITQLIIFYLFPNSNHAYRIYPLRIEEYSVRL